MAKYTFTNILGSFEFDEKLELAGKGNKGEKPNEEQLKIILKRFKDAKYFKEFREKNIRIAKKKIKESVGKDIVILQVINLIDELDKVGNTMVKRLREWYSLYLPEFENKVTDNEMFASLIVQKGKTELLRELGISKDDSMGAELSKNDVAAIVELAKQVNEIYSLREKQRVYLEKIMDEIAPNMTAITGTLIGAKLIEHAASLKKLAEMPASTLQLLGAEKALFRHMKTGAKCPKHGIIHEHQLISKARASEAGKVARALADKISIAVRIDYFKGKFIGDKLRNELEERFG